MGYAKPLLTEVLAEVDLGEQVSASHLVDLAVKLRSAGLTEAELVPRLSAGGDPFQPRLRCWSSDRRKLVQLSADQLVVNHVGDYLGWSEFVALFSLVLAAAESCGKFVPTAVAIHAIDELQTDDSAFTLGKYFACDGEFFPRWYSGCREACDISMGRGVPAEDGFNKQLTLRLRKNGEGFKVRLETRIKEHLTHGATVLGTLDRVHNDATSWFEALITEKTRDFMGGKR